MQPASTVADLADIAAGVKGAEFHRQRMFSIAAELDSARRDPRVSQSQIDSMTRQLAEHRQQLEAIEAQVKEMAS